MAEEPTNWRELVRSWIPDATDALCKQILEEHISVTASPAEMKQELADYMAAIGVTKPTEK